MPHVHGTNTRPSVPDVMPLVKAIYRRHALGCCLHVLIDDGNVDNETARFCVECATERGHADCLAAAEMLLLMTKTQRLKVYKISSHLNV